MNTRMEVVSQVTSLNPPLQLSTARNKRVANNLLMIEPLAKDYSGK